MNVVEFKQKTNYSNINITAYRAIKILKLLTEKPCSAAEIIEYLKDDELTKKSVSDDTLRFSLNSLKAVGCKIARPSSKTNYKYILQSHPFKMHITKEQVSVLRKIRKEFLNQNLWQKVLKINKLYDKIIEMTDNSNNIADLLNYQKPFAKIKPEIADFLQKENFDKKELVFTYNTSSKKTEVLNIRTNYIFCNAGRIYILGWYYKRNAFSYFNAEKISEIHSCRPADKNAKVSENFPKAIYKISGEAKEIFNPAEDDKIIYKSIDYMLIETVVKSEFKFFQQLLSAGCDFELMEPLELKKRLYEKILKIKSRYEE